MGQKANPILLKLEKTNTWESTYLGNKTTEHSIYAKTDFELWRFIQLLLTKNGCTLKTCWISYSKKSLHIFISYWQKLTLQPVKRTGSLLKFLFESLTWLNNQNLKLCVIVQKLLNAHFSRFFLNKKTIKKMLIRLQKYKRGKTFWDTVHILLVCVLHKNASKLLSHFLVNQLKSFKNHNTFFNFVSHSLNIIKGSAHSKLKGIKIVIKGRVNGRPWARKKIIDIINNISRTSPQIDFAENTSFTKNGTIGIKTWIDNN